MGTQAICIGEKKGNRETDRRLCVCYMGSTVPLLSKSKITSYPSSVTVQAGLCRTWSEPQIVGFLMHSLIFIIYNIAGSVDLGSSYFGHAGKINGLNVNTYMFSNHTSNNTYTAYITVTQEPSGKACLPVNEVAFGHRNKSKICLFVCLFHSFFLSFFLSHACESINVYSCQRGSVSLLVCLNVISNSMSE